MAAVALRMELPTLGELVANVGIGDEHKTVAPIEVEVAPIELDHVAVEVPDAAPVVVPVAPEGAGNVDTFVEINAAEVFEINPVEVVESNVAEVVEIVTVVLPEIDAPVQVEITPVVFVADEISAVVVVAVEVNAIVEGIHDVVEGQTTLPMWAVRSGSFVCCCALARVCGDCTPSFGCPCVEVVDMFEDLG